MGSRAAAAADRVVEAAMERTAWGSVADSARTVKGQSLVKTPEPLPLDQVTRRTAVPLAVMLMVLAASMDLEWH